MQVRYHEADILQLNTPGSSDALVFIENKEFMIGNSGGINHFGFRMKNAENMDELTRKVIDEGGTIIEQEESSPGFPKLFFKDLDGYEVEVWYE